MTTISVSISIPMTKFRMWLWLLTFLSCSLLVTMAADRDTEALQKGLLEEEANHNLDAAIKAYQTVIDQFENQRKLTATAIFRLGECYRKLGKTNDAVLQYQRVLRDFSDQSNLVTLSRQNIGALGSVAASVASSVGQLGANDEERKEIQRLQTMIKESPDLINSASSSSTDGNPPLNKAAYVGQMAVVQFLVANHADVNARSRSGDFAGCTPLHLAALAGHKAVAEYLLANGAEINRTTFGGNTALHIAVREGFQSIVSLLLSRKADISITGRDGLTPLDVAVTGGDKAMVELLLENGAEINGHGDDKRAPITYAAEKGLTEMVRLLLTHKASIHPHNGQLPAFYYAINQELHLETARLLLEYDPSVRDTQGNTPLDRALLGQSDPLFKMVLATKPDLEAENRDGNRPLELAMSRGSSFVGPLLDAGANPNATHPANGETPLFIAVRVPNKPHAELLLSHGANVNVTNVFGDTPLSLAELFQRNPSSPKRLASERGLPQPSLVIAYVGEGRQFEGIAELLRKHGARETVQNGSFISVNRKGSGSDQKVFTKGTNSWNYFTLFEVIAAQYQVPEDDHSPWGNVNFGNPWKDPLPFPDFSKITVHRFKPDGSKDRDITVNVEEALRTRDCGKNITLEWGDVVEIPERDHALNEEWQAFSSQTILALSKCLERTIEVTVRGQTTKVTLVASPSRGRFRFPFGLENGRSQGRGGFQPENVYRIGRVSKFTLNAALRESNLLLTSSDLTHVKVKRVDPVLKQNLQMVIDIEHSVDSASELWLRDGDVIEVPDKANGAQ